MADSDILLGTPEQVGAVRRAQGLFRLIGDDPRFAYQGRTVSYVGLTDEAVSVTADLVRLLGYASITYAPRDRADEIAARFAAEGLSPTQYDQFIGDETAIEASRAFLTDHSPPPGLRLNSVTADTDPGTLRRIAEASLERGVIPIPGRAMRSEGLRVSYRLSPTPTGKSWQAEAA